MINAVLKIINVPKIMVVPKMFAAPKIRQTTPPVTAAFSVALFTPD